jgi:lysophospholipase L1-like esterase
LYVLCCSLAASGSSQNIFGKTKTIHYLALGDSIAFGIGALPPLTGYVYHYRDYLSADAFVLLKNLSKPGITTKGLLNQLKTLKVQNADLVTLSIGGNNVLSCARDNFKELDMECAESGLKRFAKDFPKIIAKIRSLNPNATIQVMNLYNPFEESDSLYSQANEIISQLNSIIDLHQKDQYTVIDVHSAFVGNERTYTYFYGLLLKDVHPTGFGHLAIAKLHYNAL